MEKWIEDILKDKEILMKSLRDSGYFSVLEEAGKELSSSLKQGNKIVLAGNGGSAADAQHFAGELVGRFLEERKSLPAMSLCVDPSVVTCIANDYGYEEVFARQISGVGNKDDIFIAISTSGDSENCINAIKAAHEKGMTVIGFLGKDGGKMKELCDYPLIVPSEKTPRIQEIHTLTIHLLCELIERELFHE